MSLSIYNRKRKFDRTPEPHGKKIQGSKKLSFVVQEHQASSLHYDFRLELGGVMKSWAIPKGPSLNPHDRHLAVMTEDHPLDYQHFEGTIPEGNYGAGHVIIWDNGTYEPRQESGNPQKEIAKGLKAGHLTFILHGKKLRGEFALLKMQDKKAWLLVKKGDEFATEANVLELDASVVSDDKIELTPALNDLPKSKAPGAIKPMLTTLVDKPFSSPDWLFEMKWDGYRAIGTHTSQAVELYSRNGLDFTERYPEITEALHQLNHSLVLDGEVVIVDSAGRPSFELLQGWTKARLGEIRYMVFDLLWLDGHDLRELPLTQRKELLRHAIPKKGPIQYSDHVIAEGEALFEAVAKQKLEGIIAKKADSTYQTGARNNSWLKIKTGQRQEVVIGGYTEGRGTRQHIGALLVGVYHGGSLTYTAHVNTAMPDKEREALWQQLVKLEQPSSPFSNQFELNAPAHWVKPRLVCEVEFKEWTKEDYMRQPIFKGMRPDKSPHEVHKEEPKHSTPSAAGKKSKVEFTHLDKVFWPERGYTKGDLIEYYRSMSKALLPYLKDRPLSMLRQPGGYKDRGFFQKDVTFDLPPFAKTTTIHSDSTNEDIHFLICNNEETLLYMAQLGNIEINPWSSRIGHLDKPDWAVMDLDPEGVSFSTVIKVAQTVREVCQEWGVEGIPKTSGKTGIHIYFPLGAKYTYEQARNFVHLLGLEVHKRQPKLTSLERSPADRQHRIYLDYLQNARGQTLATAYSVRPTKDASVAMPLHWDEVTAKLKPSDFTIKNALKRVERVGDLWVPVLGKGIDLAKVLKKLEP